MHIHKLLFKVALLSLVLAGCTSKESSPEKNNDIVVIKGLYSFGPEVKSFTDCLEREFWVADSAKTLELAYNNLGFEKPYTPVYVELEGRILKSDTATITGNYDSTLVVTKLLKISKQIPEGPCSQ